MIERDAAGEPTGFLIERPAAELVERAMPAPTLEDRLRWLRAIQPRFVAAGITGVVDPALEAAELLAYAAADERGELSLRVTGMPLGDGEVPPAERAAAFAAAGVDLGARDGAFWRIGPWKLFLDGGGSLGTALLYEPWPGTDDYLGNQTTSTSGLNEYAEWAAATGAGLGVHCVGSAAIDLFIDACEKGAAVRAAGRASASPRSTPTSGRAPSRWRVSATSTSWSPPSRRSSTPSGRDWCAASAPSRSATPIRCGAGSSPARSSAAAATGPATASRPRSPRSGPSGRCARGRSKAAKSRSAPQEAVTAEQALGLYTTGAAAVAMAPDRGRLSPGYVADLAALEVDPLAATPEQCRDAGVLATMIAGALVHDAR